MERPHPESMPTGSPVSLWAGDGGGLGGMREERAAPQYCLCVVLLENLKVTPGINGGGGDGGAG